MLKLGVNIDHVATLREARYRGRDIGEPSPVEAARVCEAAGAHGIEAAVRTGCTYASINALLKQLHDEREERTSVASAHTPPPS